MREQNEAVSNETQLHSALWVGTFCTGCSSPWTDELKSYPTSYSVLNKATTWLYHSYALLYNKTVHQRFFSLWDFLNIAHREITFEAY